MNVVFKTQPINIRDSKWLSFLQFRHAQIFYGYNYLILNDPVQCECSSVILKAGFKN